MNVMLLAAGEGTRLQPYTISTPKPAIPFLTVPLAGFSLSLIEKLMINNLVVNTYHLPTQVEYLFKDFKIKNRNLVFSSEKDQLLDSGGGIHNAKKYLIGQNDFLVMNSDEVILPHQLGLIEDLIYFHKSERPIATLLTMKHAEVGKKFGGAWSLQNSAEIKMFSKTTPGLEYEGHHYLGVMILSDQIFRYFNEFVSKENILYDTLTKAMANEERVLSFNCECQWFETGNPKDFIEASDYCLTALEICSQDFWVQYLEQVIRVYGMSKSLIEKDYFQTEEKLRSVFLKRQFNYFPDKNEPF